jgi:phosphate transport system substrate-binding protein
MMTLWAEEFKRIYPNVNVQIQAAGSSTAPTALTEGVAQFGPMSRGMKSGEEEAFEKRYGYKPTAIRVAVDALAVFVNKDNPIKGLTMPQIDAIFSSTLKCGEAKAAAKWSDLGLDGNWSAKDLQLFGRNSVSGTYGYFKEHALCNGDFKSGVNEQPGSASVVQSVSASLNGIGYSGIGYVTSGVRAVPLSKDGKTFIDATADNAITGKYPLSRFLYVYVNKHPNKPLSPMEQEFVKMMLSKAGQSIVAKDGYVPVPAKVVEADLKKLGII